MLNKPADVCTDLYKLLKSSDFYLVNYEVANCIVQFSNSRFESVLDNNGGSTVQRNNVDMLVHFCILKLHVSHVENKPGKRPL